MDDGRRTMDDGPWTVDHGSPGPRAYSPHPKAMGRCPWTVSSGSRAPWTAGLQPAPGPFLRSRQLTAIARGQSETVPPLAPGPPALDRGLIARFLTLVGVDADPPSRTADVPSAPRSSHRDSRRLSLQGAAGVLRPPGARSVLPVLATHKETLLHAHGTGSLAFTCGRPRLSCYARGVAGSSPLRPNRRQGDGHSYFTLKSALVEVSPTVTVTS